MKKEKKNFKRAVKGLKNFHKIDNLEAEATMWYDVWANKDILHDLLKDATTQRSRKI